MTPDEFFDELDEIFGSNDGYMYHLERIKDLKEQKELNMFHLKEFVKKVEKLEAENEKLKEELDEKYSFSYFKQVKELTAENEKLKEIIDR
jgi:cell shape-determining protein MreC